MIFKESYFLISINFRSISLQKVVKQMVWNQSVMAFLQKHHNVGPGDLFWVQKWFGISQEKTKNPKICRKK